MQKLGIKKNKINTRSSEFAFPGYCSSELNFTWTVTNATKNAQCQSLNMQNAKTGRVETRLTWSTGHPDSFSPPLSAFIWRSPVFLFLCFASVSLLSLSSVLFSFFFSFTMTKGWKKETPLIPCYLRCSFLSLFFLFSFCLVLSASLLFLFCLFFPVQWRFRY